MYNEAVEKLISKTSPQTRPCYSVFSIFITAV